jgi:CheY-like chemotaxis protein
VDQVLWYLDLVVTRQPPPVTLEEDASRVRCRGALGASVLVIDDVGEARTVSAACLEFRGFRAEVARDGPSGLAMAVAIVPDVVLLDFSMPKMDGEEVVRRLKEDERTRTILIVMLTAIPEAVSPGTRANLAAFLEKPCDAERLVEAVANVVALRAARSAAHK